MEGFSDAGSTPAASTKRRKNRLNRRFFSFIHVFYTILFKIDTARSSSRG